MPRTEVFRQRLLVLSARDRHRVKPHLRRELNTEMTQSADPKYADKITGSRAAVTQRVERCDSCAHQWRPLNGVQIVRHRREGFRRCEHVFGISAIERDSSREQFHLAGKEIAAPTGIAMSAMRSVPSNARPLPRFPIRNVGPDSINHADHLMAGNSRILDPGPESIFD